MRNRLFFFAGILSFVSAFFVVAGLLVSYVLTPTPPQNVQSIEDVSETFIFLFSPVLLLPAILAVYRLLFQDYPRLALFSLILGLIGFGGLLAWSVLTVFTIPTFAGDQTVVYVEVMLMGLWTLITAVAILVFESKNLVLGEGRSYFYGFLFLSGLVCGLAMILYSWSILMTQPVRGVTNLSILIWLITYPFWLIGLGLCLLNYSREPALLITNKT